jgi:hypothetical protein
MDNIDAVEEKINSVDVNSNSEIKFLESLVEEPKNSYDYSRTDLVIYHGKCPDGIASAWCFWDLLDKDDSKFHPGKFNEVPPDVTNKNVVFVDFSYQFDDMLKLISAAKSVRVLDHHKTANRLLNINNLRFSIILDMSRSGAQITWDELNPGKARPWFIDDIGDRDLWKWQIEDSKNTTRAMFGLDYYTSIEKFDAIRYSNRDVFVQLGNILNTDDERQYKSITDGAIDCIATSPKDPGLSWRVRAVSCSHAHASEVGNRLVKDKLCDFAVMYRYDILRDEWWISCRALPESSIDLTTILKHFDEKSGGHAKAAGMTIKSLREVFKPCDKKFIEQEAQSAINRLIEKIEEKSI